jgi:hypothetical protein
MEMYKVYLQVFLFEFYMNHRMGVVLHHHLIDFHGYFLMFLERYIAIYYHLFHHL